MSNSNQAAPKEIRDGIIFQGPMVTQCIQEAIEEMSSIKKAQYQSVLKTNSFFESTLKLMTINLIVVLSAAKSFEKDEDFTQMLEVLDDVDFKEFNGMVYVFALHLIDLDIKSKDSEESYLYDFLPVDIIRRRQQKIVDYIQSRYR